MGLGLNRGPGLGGLRRIELGVHLGVHLGMLRLVGEHVGVDSSHILVEGLLDSGGLARSNTGLCVLRHRCGDARLVERC